MGRTLREGDTLKRQDGEEGRRRNCRNWGDITVILIVLGSGLVPGYERRIFELLRHRSQSQ